MSNPISQTGYDYVILAGQRSPGIATVEGANSPRRLVERRGFGLSGATVRFAGVTLSHFKLKLELLTAAHFDAWTEWRPLVQTPPAGERAHALAIEHPFLEELGIRAVLVEDVLQPKQIGDGQWEVEILLCEYRRPTPALSGPDGAATRPESAEAAEIRRLTAITEGLADGTSYASPLEGLFP